MGGNLHISHLNKDEDVGIYQCLASNLFGTIVSREASLHVACECYFMSNVTFIEQVYLISWWSGSLAEGLGCAHSKFWVMLTAWTGVWAPLLPCDFSITPPWTYAIEGDDGWLDELNVFCYCIEYNVDHNECFYRCNIKKWIFPAVWSMTFFFSSKHNHEPLARKKSIILNYNSSCPFSFYFASVKLTSSQLLYCIDPVFVFLGKVKVSSNNRCSA